MCVESEVAVDGWVGMSGLGGRWLGSVGRVDLEGLRWDYSTGIRPLFTGC